MVDEVSLLKLCWDVMPQVLIDDKSTLVQVIAWCRQATSHYLSQCWPRSLSPYGVTRPQWVKSKDEKYIVVTMQLISVATHQSSDIHINTQSSIKICCSCGVYCRVFIAGVYCGFVPASKLALYRPWTCRSKTGFVPTLNQPLQNRLCACSKTGFAPTLNLPFHFE